MSFKVSPYQKYDSLDWAGLTTENHWGMLYNQHPLMMNNVIENIYKVNLGDDIISFMDQFPTKYLDQDVAHEWMLQGADEKSIPLEAAYLDKAMGTVVSASSVAGKNFTSFYLKFPERYFGVSQVILGNKIDLYALRVMEEPIPVGGTSYLYEVKLVDDDATKYVPYEELVAGVEYSKGWSLSEQTLSSRGSDTHHTSPFRMQAWMSMIRKTELVPGNMIRKGKNDPQAFSFKTPSGEQLTTWLNKLDYDFYTQFRREVARMAVYGRSNKLVDGTFSMKGDSGYEIRSSPGLRQQIAPGNISYYNTFNLENMVDFALEQLAIGKLPHDSRKFTLMTGEQGMKVFSRAVEAYGAGSSNGTIYNYNRVDALKGGSNGSFHRPQYTKVIDINGIEFTILHNPDYDNRIMHKIRHDKGGVAESHRFTMLDFGSQDGGPNIQKLALKGEDEIYKYIPGLRDPFSAGGNGSTPGLIANSVDGYQLERMQIGGIYVKNPLRTGEFIPVELA